MHETTTYFPKSDEVFQAFEVGTCTTPDAAWKFANGTTGGCGHVLPVLQHTKLLKNKNFKKVLPEHLRSDLTEHRGAHDENSFGE